MGVQMQIAGAVLGVLAAKQQSDISKMEAQAYKEKADLASLKAQQDEDARRMQLRRQLASLGVSMTASGVAIGTSASMDAIAAGERDIARKDINNIKLMGQSTRRNYQISAVGSQAAGKAIMLGGLAKGAGAAYSIGKGPTDT